MSEKAKGFVATGSEIYHRNLPDGAKEHHRMSRKARMIFGAGGSDRSYYK